MSGTHRQHNRKTALAKAGAETFRTSKPAVQRLVTIGKGDAAASFPVSGTKKSLGVGSEVVKQEFTVCYDEKGAGVYATRTTIKVEHREIGRYDGSMEGLYPQNVAQAVLDAATAEPNALEQLMLGFEKAKISTSAVTLSKSSKPAWLSDQ